MGRDRRDSSSGGGEGGNFWTSYSDLMVGMAIIFLVMFFFATLRAGVEQMKHKVAQKQTEDYLKGKVPEDVAKQNQQQQEFVKHTVADIEKKKEVLANSATQVADLVNNLSAHQQVLTDLMKDQVEKATMLKVANEQNTQLETEVHKLNQVKEEMDRAIREREATLAQLNQKIQMLDTTRAQLEASQAQLTQSLKQREDELERTEAAVTQLKQTVSDRDTENSRLTLNLKQKEDALAQTTEKLQAVDAELAQRESTLAQMKQAVADRDQAIEKTSAQLQLRENELHQTRVKLDNASAALTHRDSELAAMKQKQGEIEYENTRLAVDVQEKDSALNRANAKITSLSGELDGQKQTVAQLSQELKQQGSAMAGVTAERDRLDRDLRGANSALENERQRTAKLNQEMDSLDGRLSAANTENSRLKNDLQLTRGDLAKAKSDADGAHRAFASKDAEATNLKRGLDDARGKLAKSESDNRGLKSALDAAKLSLTGMEGAMSLEKHRAEKCENTLAILRENDQNKTRKLASLDTELKKAQNEITTLGEQRKNIANNIGASMRQNGIDVEVNPESGMMTLSMDEVFHFENGSSELSKAAKEKLRKIMPIYAKSLFGKFENAAKIASITIAGHSSPRYRKKFVDPLGHDTTARNFNLELSRKRAKQVADFVFGADAGYYPYKDDFKLKTRVVGKGFNESIKLKPGVKTAEKCGIYDCAKSRRVEITFLLKEEKPAPRYPASLPPQVRIPFAPTKGSSQ